MKPAEPRRAPRTVLLFILNLLAMLILLGAAAAVFISTLVQITAILPGIPTLASPLQNILLACGLTFGGFLMAPAAFHSFQAMLSKPDRASDLQPLRPWWLVAILITWIAVAVSAQVLGETPANWLLLPPLVLAGMSLPIYLLFRLGTGGLGLGSRQRAWNVFGLGLAAGPAMAGAVEMGAYLLVLTGGGLIMALKPEWQAEYTRITAQVQQASSMDQILSIMSPYLLNPAAILLVLLVVSVFIPLVEELAKPIGVWLLRRRPPTPQEGFALGVISGAGFALLESLLAASSNNGQWGVAFVARIGGGVMHTLNSGLMGWAIASFWQERRPGKLARTFGLVVFLHGLWNGLTVATIIGGLRVMAAPSGIDFLGSLLVLISIPGLILLAAGGLVFLIIFNRRMRPGAAAGMQAAHQESGAQPQALPGGRGEYP